MFKVGTSFHVLYVICGDNSCETSISANIIDMAVCKGMQNDDDDCY